MNIEQSQPQDDQSHSGEVTKIPLAELAPIAENKRIDTMDILRGFALIGIIMMNIEWFNRTISGLGGFDFTLTGGDWSAGWLVRLFVEGKFYKLFSLLFGMGFAIMLLRAQEVGRPFGAWFSRRMIILFLFGMAHMVFLWGGDILHDYAVGGMLLLGWVMLLRVKFMQRFDNSRSFLRFGLGLFIVPVIGMIGAGIYFGSTWTKDTMGEKYDERVAVLAKVEVIKQDPVLSASVSAKAKAKKEADKLAEANGEEIKEVDEDAMTPEALIDYKAEKRFMRDQRRDERVEKETFAFTKGTYWEATQYRAKEAVKSLKGLVFFIPFMTFPLFLIGYWFIASGVLREPKKHLGLFKSMAWVGAIVGTFFSIGALMLMTHPITKNANEIRGVSNMLFQYSQLLMTAGYLGLIVLATMTVRGKRWLSWLAPLGRMALTNYIMHSIILSSIFFGYAGGMYGEISRAPQMVIVVAILLCQTVLSAWWLKQFKFGPLEWLWRSLTYLKVQPMRIEKKPLSAEPAHAISG